MKIHKTNNNIARSAESAGMSPKTACKYIKGGYPNEAEPRHWKTRVDPFESIWKEIEGYLSSSLEPDGPQITAKDLFEHFLTQYPRILNGGQLRTFQRRVKEWYKQNRKSPVQDIFFEQRHIPGRLLQMDWFYPNTFEVTIKDEPYKHLLCHAVLTYSNWEWLEPCRSESYLSLKSCLQSALFELGFVPELLQTDNSSSATHRLRKKYKPRIINDKFKNLVDHYGMDSQTINLKSPNENGDVESQNGHFRTYMKGQLALRGHNDFESLEAYRKWLIGLATCRNEPRKAKLKEELLSMKELTMNRLPDYEEEDCRINKYGLVRIGKGSYSLPRKYRNSQVLRSRIYESRIEIWNEEKCLAKFETNPNDSGARINYRHLLLDLLRKPGAFARYRYREEFIPGEIWRECYDYLLSNHSEKRAGKEYLSLLALTLEHSQEEIQKIFFRLLGKSALSLENAKHELGILKKPEEYPDIVTAPDLCIYDQQFLEEVNHG